MSGTPLLVDVRVLQRFLNSLSKVLARCGVSGRAGVFGRPGVCERTGVCERAGVCGRVEPDLSGTGSSFRFGRGPLGDCIGRL